MTTEKIIPLSVIDARIKEFEEWLRATAKEDSDDWFVFAAVIKKLERTKEEIKKEALVQSPIEQKINETIKDFKTIAKHDPPEDSITQYVIKVVIPTLEKLLE